MNDSDSSQRQLAVTIAKEVSPTEAEALRVWATRILEIRAENISAIQKAKKAVRHTVSSKVILPAVKIIARQTKKHGWHNRSSTQRLGMGVAAVGVAIFGGANAGIAALGGAIGVPLWMVLGGGAMFAKYLVDELVKREKSAATYTIINADKDG
ncbi:hypothetical protein V7799_19130 [Rhizobium laguerreae]